MKDGFMAESGVALPANDDDTAVWYMFLMKRW
jgi:hypothetical protein